MKNYYLMSWKRNGNAFYTGPWKHLKDLQNWKKENCPNKTTTIYNFSNKYSKTEFTGDVLDKETFIKELNKK